MTRPEVVERAVADADPTYTLAMACRAELDRHGFVIVPGFLSADEVAAGRENLRRYYPTPDEFYAAAPRRYPSLNEDILSSLVVFPFVDDALNDQLTSARLVALVRQLIGVPRLRMTMGRIWAKYSSSIDYEQGLHRDFSAQTLLWPRERDEYRNLQCWLYYSDITEECGPTRLLSHEYTKDLPLDVHALHRTERKDARSDGLVALARPDLYAYEVAAVGSAGTLVIWDISAFHRGSALGPPPAYRWLASPCFVASGLVSGSVQGAFSPGSEMTRFLTRASVEQRALIGFPEPGDPYWTEETLSGVAIRYPELDLGPYQAAIDRDV